MIFNVFSIALLHWQALAWISVAQILDDVLESVPQALWERYFVDTLRHLLVNLHRCCRFEGRMANHKLEGENTKGPPSAHGISTTTLGGLAGWRFKLPPGVGGS